jgi:dephospho-CoA kinase
MSAPPFLALPRCSLVAAGAVAEPADMLRVGLTGGIGSGKSEVSRRLGAYGAIVIDADLIAREVVAPGTDGLAEVVGEFGPGVVGPDAALDRARLGDLVFADQQKLATLNAIVHPRVGARMDELAASAGPDSIVVYDVPLIAENDLAADYDLVIVVDVPPRMQVDRLVRLRGMSRDQARSRMAAQAARDRRLSIADIVVDNSGSLAELDRQVGDLWTELRRREALAAS